MKFLLDKKQALWVEEAYEEDFVYIWLKGPCLDKMSWKPVMNPSSLFYACYQGLDILKKYGDWQDPRALQKIKYLPTEIYEELSPRYAHGEEDPFHRDVFLVVLTLCELLRLTKDETLDYIADGVYGWITQYEDSAHDSYRTQLMQLENEIVLEYTHHSPMLIMAKRMEQEGAIHRSGEVNIISYVRNYLNSERRISDEIKELLRNNGDRSKVQGLAQSDAVQAAAVSEGANKEEAGRLEARVKELEGLLEEKEMELAELREGVPSAESGTPIRIADRKKSRLEVLLVGLYYADYFVNDKGVKLGRDETIQEILKHGFQCESGRISKDISQYIKTGTITAFKEDLIKDFKAALDDVKKVQR